ncbi:MAG: cyclopropane-fatty-acyl-phospholipid synthase family protein [Dehalococcoidia bacterium]
MVRSLASRAREGCLTVEYPDGSISTFGSPTASRTATLRVHSDEFFRRLVLHGEIGFGEAYMDGLWSSDDLVGLVELAILNRRFYSANSTWLSWLSRLRNRRLHVGRRNTRSKAKENIHAHYDLNNEFFRLFLDETMTYSCAVFSRDDEALADAQLNKYRAVAEKAGLVPGDTVLEIGTGWGGFAMFMAQQFGCQVTTITISEEQHALARQRVEEAGLSDAVRVELRDYRDVPGQFDKIVSIEMFEAVGVEYFETFFKHCDAALRPGGRMCMQVITVPDRSFPAQRDGINWLNKHIFPGGVVPSISAMEQALAPTTLLVTRVDEIGLNYTGTLRRWRHRFLENLPAVRALGFDDRFIRMWEYYLASCEAAFQTRTLCDVQIVFDKPSV